MGKIHPSNSIKYLGIYLDYDLSGKHQCSVLKNKLNRSIGMLSKARHYIPSDELVSLYYVIFSSHMTYGCQIWYNNNVHSDKIKSSQNKAIRAITFSDFNAPTKPLMKEKNILSISDLIILQNILFVHDYFHDKLPLCFRNYFTLVSDVQNRSTIGSSIGTLYIYQKSKPNLVIIFW